METKTFEPVTDVEVAKDIRYKLLGKLGEVVAILNNAKIEHGFNVDFLLQKNPQTGLCDILDGDRTIRITKDM